MPIVATVTRSTVSRFFSQTPQNVGNTGGHNFSLRKSDGTFLGAYRSVGEAQAAFNAFHGPNRILKWERQDLAGSIEQWVAIGTPLDPREVWALGPITAQQPNAQPASSLIQWMQPSVALGSVKLEAVANGDIASISDLSGSGNTLVSSVKRPQLISSDPNFNGLPVVEMTPTSGFTIPNLAALATPYTIIVVANNVAAGGANSNLLDIDVGGATPLQLLETNPGGLWQLDVGGSTLNGPASGTPPAILTIKGDGVSTTFRVNGTAIGTIAAASSAGAVEIGGLSTLAWTGRLAFLSISTLADPDNTRILQAERYCRENFQ